MLSPRPELGIVFIHGNTGKFNDYPYVVISRYLAELGCTVINGNTRGHDISVTLWKTTGDVPVAGGSAWEIYEDSPIDLAAWIDHAESRGIKQVILIGHSLGAAKAVYYQARRQDLRIQGIVLASPDLHGHWSPELVAAAQRLVDSGKGEELLPAIMGSYWYRLSARNIVSRANILSKVFAGDIDRPFIAAIRCPILAVFGTGGDVGAESELQIIQRNASGAARINTMLIDGADHVYTDHERELAEAIVAWIDTI